MSIDTNDYLFEKMFFQAAEISILDVALKQARDDLISLGATHDINVDVELVKINIAYASIQKLKNGTPPNEL